MLIKTTVKLYTKPLENKQRRINILKKSKKYLLNIWKNTCGSHTFSHTQHSGARGPWISVSPRSPGPHSLFLTSQSFVVRPCQSQNNNKIPQNLLGKLNISMESSHFLFFLDVCVYFFILALSTETRLILGQTLSTIQFALDIVFLGSLGS